ncbi:uncharacterized protein ARMOST_21225 [Armillaria ostoyae]|uniref:Uncharacterized protein n=1 Tax=Armillaria ostoyae TaxID=47428 RepID=A0A284S9L2_ARMOS|nr:uncharacterized protein ARMOST_21225 [Armillaria ostoyae]
MDNGTKRRKMNLDAKDKAPPTGSQGKNGRQIKKRLKGRIGSFRGHAARHYTLYLRSTGSFRLIVLGASIKGFPARSDVQAVHFNLEVCEERHWKTP